MIENWLVTGDTHGDMSRFDTIDYSPNPGMINIIILGDSGCNYYGGKEDADIKNKLNKTRANFYLVRGNHEERPENVSGMIKTYDETVDGMVYLQYEYPHIKYLMDGGIYNINGLKTLVIGGAYSVDKYYRLAMGYKWFSEEQLTSDEMAAITEKVKGQKFDLVLTHTCPLDWKPTDLFLKEVDQSMEIWLNDLKNEIDWKIWLFGHYHSDRLERPHVQMLYKNIENLSDIWDRWMNNKIDLSLPRSPKYEE